MSENCYILKLPDELLFFLAELLNGKDVICFSLACRRFSMVCRRLRYNLNPLIKHFKLFMNLFVFVENFIWKIVGELEYQLKISNHISLSVLILSWLKNVTLIIAIGFQLLSCKTFSENVAIWKCFIYLKQDWIAAI